jgi:hypothetical protein
VTLGRRHRPRHGPAGPKCRSGQPAAAGVELEVELLSEDDFVGFEPVSEVVDVGVDAAPSEVEVEGVVAAGVVLEEVPRLSFL